MKIFCYVWNLWSKNAKTLPSSWPYIGKFWEKLKFWAPIISFYLNGRLQPAVLACFLKFMMTVILTEVFLCWFAFYRFWFVQSNAQPRTSCDSFSVRSSFTSALLSAAGSFLDLTTSRSVLPDGFVHFFTFYARKRPLLSAHLSQRNSVRPSICMSVCLSHGWISQKWCKLGSPNLHHQLPERLVLGTVKLFHTFKGATPNKGSKWEVGRKHLRFLANKSLHLNNGAR